jgi:3-hydroxyisobutyrate dehydrogenase
MAMPAEVHRVAVLGTGIMGAPMARNLAGAGLAVSAWNRSPARAEPLAEDGIEVAPSAAAAAGGADAVITMLSDGPAVRAVIGAGEPVLEAMNQEAIWVQMSTVGVEATREFAELAASAGMEFVDSPVLGSKQPAEDGQLIVLASGADDTLDRCAPIFDGVGSRTERLGEAGHGTRTKLVLNSWLLALMAGLAETISVAETLGVDPKRFLEIIDGGPVNAGYAQLKGRMMIEREFEPSFPLRHALKDADLVLEACEREGVSLPLIDTLERTFTRAEELGHGDEDMAAVYEAARDR